MTIQIQYDPLPTPADCSVVAIQAALLQLGEIAKYVSSDVFVSESWTDEDVESLNHVLEVENCLANRVRKSKWLKPFEWYVECCGNRVGCNPD